MLNDEKVPLGEWQKLVAENEQLHARVEIEAKAAQELRRERDGLRAALREFVIRVAEFSDYTHDEVDEKTILHELQREAQNLLMEFEPDLHQPLNAHGHWVGCECNTCREVT